MIEAQSKPDSTIPNPKRTFDIRIGWAKRNAIHIIHSPIPAIYRSYAMDEKSRLGFEC